MGTVASTLRGSAQAIKMVAGMLYQIYGQYRSLNNRINLPPGLPRPSPTRSFWQDDPPFPELVDAQSAKLPLQADVVIIGSGITGVAVAKSLLEETVSTSGFSSSSSAHDSPQPTVVVLEARQLCSGATGRNGGQIKPSPHEMLHVLMNRQGMPGARAAALVRFQLAHLGYLLALCGGSHDDTTGSSPGPGPRTGLQRLAECREVETVDLFVDDSRFREAKRLVHQLAEWVPECTIHVWTAKEAQEKFSAAPHVVGALSYQAGALWPYRLVTALWRHLMDTYPDALAIETNTPVMAIDVTTKGKDGTDKPYYVLTPRGVIRARHVVHATNAFATELLPRLRRKVTGVRGHMSAQKPDPGFPGLDGQRSWSVFYASGFDYITQRPTTTVGGSDHAGNDSTEAVHGSPGGDILVGGGFVRSAQEGLDQIAVFDDTNMDLYTAIHLHGMPRAVFSPNHHDSGEGHDNGGDGHVQRLWSGIIAATADWVPFVGRLDPRLTDRRPVASPSSSSSTATTAVQPGEWISAAYMGDGMVWAWLCGTAVGLMLAGLDQDDLSPRPGRPAGRVADWLPPELLATYERLQRIDMADLVGMSV